MLYFDTDVLRKLGQAFRSVSLPVNVREKITLSPISALEILSQLTVESAGDVLASIQRMRNWIPDPVGMLDWPDTFIAQVVFEKQLDDKLYEQVGNALNACFQAGSANELKEPAAHLRDMLDELKHRQARRNQDFIQDYRTRPADDQELRMAFTEAVSSRVGSQPGERPVERITSSLSAYFEYQTKKLSRALVNPNYNFFSHLNDILDAEQLVYLATPELHFLTGDGGFGSVQESEQRVRIHVAEHAQLTGTAAATALLSELG